MIGLPWHHDAAQQMLSSISKAQLTHAWIIKGSKGTGRHQFVQDIAQFLLCESPAEGSACGKCQSCHWYGAGTHPDKIELVPETEGKAIKVDQIRDLIDKLSLSSHGKQGNRVVIIRPAEAMNRQSANSLLKSLEEPPQNTYFFLVTTELAGLSATIRSRCQLLNLPSPRVEQATEWLNQEYGPSPDMPLVLEMADYGPILALQILESGGLSAYQELFNEFMAVNESGTTPGILAERWLKQEQHMPINWLLRWMSVLIKLKQAGTVAEYLHYSIPSVEKILKAVQIKQLYQFYDDVLETSRLWAVPLNRRLQLEGLFTKWYSLFQK